MYNCILDGRVAVASRPEARSGVIARVLETNQACRQMRDAGSVGYAPPQTYLIVFDPDTPACDGKVQPGPDRRRAKTTKTCSPSSHWSGGGHGCLDWDSKERGDLSMTTVCFIVRLASLRFHREEDRLKSGKEALCHDR